MAIAHILAPDVDGVLCDGMRECCEASRGPTGTSGLTNRGLGRTSFPRFVHSALTAKEVMARAPHQRSARRHHAFITVNGAALPSGVLESELFGHERGAFTGAERRRIGLFEAAHRGTLFLDEVGELPAAVQPALLRVLQFGEVRPVGGERSRTVDVRVLAATNRDLLREVREGRFREDLYYRLAPFHLIVPPLRERPEDLPTLARTFLARAGQRAGRRLVLDDSGLARLAQHAWPGNIRELENVTTRLAVLAEGEVLGAAEIEALAFGRGAAAPPPAALPTLQLEELERRAIAEALARHGGDKRAAARTLGISLRALYYKMERFGFKPPPVAAAGSAGSAGPSEPPGSAAP
jgi:two-component system response regulator HydG